MVETKRAGILCPECGRCGDRSTVTEIGETVTDLRIRTFWDPDGKAHRHDPNVYTGLYECSLGHQFARPIITDCWNCDFNRGRTVAVS